MRGLESSEGMSAMGERQLSGNPEAASGKDAWDGGPASPLLLPPGRPSPQGWSRPSLAACLGLRRIPFP